MSSPSVVEAAQSIQTPQARRRAALAAGFGTCVEANDLVMYAFLATYTAPLWFPAEDPAVSVIATLGVYGVGFVARPIGGIFFGRMGDRRGRRQTLVATLALMGLATLCLGLIPTHASIGVFTPILVVLARMAQGFAAGGEVMGAATYALESSSAGRRGLFISFTPAGSYVGLTMATLMIGSTSAILGHETMAAWGWRIPFVVSFLFTAALLAFRLRVEDSAEFQVLERTQAISKTPVRDSWYSYKAPILLAIAMGVGVLYALYTINTYIPVYLTTVTKLPASSVSWMLAVVLLLGAPATLLGGWLADRFGRVRMAVIMLILFAIIGMLSFIGLSKPSLGVVGVGAIYLAPVLCGALLIGPIYQTFADIFPARIRYTSAAIGFNVANMIGAGFGPLLSAEIIHLTGDPRAPGWMLAIGALIGIVGILALTRLLKTADGSPASTRART